MESVSEGPTAADLIGWWSRSAVNSNNLAKLITSTFIARSFEQGDFNSTSCGGKSEYVDPI